MAEQLTIFGLWENAEQQPVVAPEPPSPPPEPPPIDPRQADLLSGPQTMRAALEIACESLDANAVRARHAALTSRFIGQRWAEHAPDWAGGIEWLIGHPAGSLSVDEQVDRALALGEDAAGAANFPSLPRRLLMLVRAESLRRAGTRLIEERGALSRAPNGEPAGWLFLVAGDAAGARERLADAITAIERGSAAEFDFPIARAWCWLAEAEWLAGQHNAAVRAYVRACLCGRAMIESEISCEPVLDLFDAAADLELPAPVSDWIPVLADLLGVLRLGEEAVGVPPGASPARQLAAELALYHKDRGAAGFDETARIETKRRMVRLAPPTLRELLRKV